MPQIKWDGRGEPSINHFDKRLSKIVLFFLLHVHHSTGLANFKHKVHEKNVRSSFYSTFGHHLIQAEFTHPGHRFTYVGFPECPCCLECDIYSRLCYVDGLMILDYNHKKVWSSYLIVRTRLPLLHS